MIVIPAKAGIQIYWNNWIPGQAWNDKTEFLTFYELILLNGIIFE
jgi:hypothetical protein